MLNMGILCSWDCIWNKIICLVSIFSADFYLVKGFDLLNILNLKGSYRKGLTCPKWAGRNRSGTMKDRLFPSHFTVKNHSDGVSQCNQFNQSIKQLNQCCWSIQVELLNDWFGTYPILNDVFISLICINYFSII